MAASLGRYDIGDLVRLQATYVSTDLVTPADPSTILFFVKSPASAVACYSFVTLGASVARAATGAYFKDLTVDVYGRWYYRSLGTGGVQAAEEWYFDVDQSFVL